MTSSWRSVTQRISVALCSALLVLLLAACGGTGTTGGSATPTPKSTPTIPPTPTVAMQTYTGTGYTISYPQGIAAKASGNGVSFTDTTTGNMLVISEASNPGGAASTSVSANASMQIYEKTFLTNAQPATVAPTATVGSESWVQLSATGTLAFLDAGTPGTLIQLADTHSGTLYEIVYFGPTSTFTQANTMVFQPMLASFKFTS
jgi:hypothetical protein